MFLNVPSKLLFFFRFFLFRSKFLRLFESMMSKKIQIHFNKDKQKEKKSSLSLDVSGYGIFICSFARLDVFIDKKIFPSLKEPKTGFAKYPNFLHISFIHFRTFLWMISQQTTKNVLLIEKRSLEKIIMMM